MTLTKIVKASRAMARELNHYEKEIVKSISEKAGIPEQQAKTYLLDSQQWEVLMENKKKSLDLDLVELIQDFKGSIKSKIESGKLEEARSGMMGVALAYDKLFGKQEKKSVMEVKGKATKGKGNTAVAIPFEFQSYVQKRSKR